MLLTPGWGFGISAGGAAPTESLAAGDLTTAFANWLAGLGVPKNEAVRAALTTHYSVDGDEDLSTVLSRFLRDRA
jgi:hypothetical protein